MIRAFFGCVLMLLFVGCSSAKYDDVSNSDEFSYLIDQKFMTLDELLIIGVTSDANYEKRIDYYSVIPKPGFDGPEVVTRNVLPAGTLIQIRKVMRCANCMSQKIYFIIESMSDQKYRAAVIRLSDIGAISVSELDGDQVRLNPELFQVILE